MSALCLCWLRVPRWGFANVSEPWGAGASERDARRGGDDFLPTDSFFLMRVHALSLPWERDRVV